jgi:hypothetical protein
LALVKIEQVGGSVQLCEGLCQHGIYDVDKLGAAVEYDCQGDGVDIESLRVGQGSFQCRESRHQVVHREGQSNPEIVETREAAGCLGRACKVLNCQQDVLEVEKHLEHQIVEAVLTKEPEAV